MCVNACVCLYVWCAASVYVLHLCMCVWMHACMVERGSSVVERRTRNLVSAGSNHSFLPFRRLGIFVLSIDAPVDSAV